MGYGMTTPAPAPRNKPDEGGFILIEVLVSALILAIVAGAVLSLITATTHSAASERNHSQAYALAQEDQARLRTMRISNLIALNEPPQNKTINGTRFTVESNALFVNNSTGSPSCTKQNATADYVEISSTVTSPTLLQPVVIQGVVSPSNGSLDPGHGTITFQATNAAGTPLSGVKITSTSGPRPISGMTDENGCAIFADLPAGNYKVTTSAGTLISPEGNTTQTKTVGVEASSTNQVTIHFDKAAAIKPSFVYLEPKTNKLTPAPVDAMVLYDAEFENGAIFEGTPGSEPRTTTLEDSTVYPFKTPYSVYAGSCEQYNNPDPAEKGINKPAIAIVEAKGGGTYTPTIQVPALNLGVTYNSSNVLGAKVVLTDAQCTYNSRSIKRIFYTNVSGHIAQTAATTSPSYNATEANTEAVGLPFGTYNICVSAKLSGNEWKKYEGSVKLESLTTAASKQIALSSNSKSECS
jgi:type II secretory pathway pseudopilin PulG